MPTLEYPYQDRSGTVHVNHSVLGIDNPHVGSELGEFVNALNPEDSELPDWYAVALFLEHHAEDVAENVRQDVSSLPEEDIKEDVVEIERRQAENQQGGY